MKAVGQLEQVTRQNVRTKIVQDLRDYFPKLTETFREIDLRRFGKNQLLDLRPSLARFAKDRANPDAGILQVRRGVPLQGQHPVPRKNVIRHSILREIAVLDRAEPNFLRDVDLLCVTQLRIFFIDNLTGATASLFE